MSKRNGQAYCPPYSEDAELSVLGSIILDPRHLDPVAQRLTPDDFHLPRCAAVLREMLSMRADGVPIDTAILAARLENHKDVSLADLAEMADAVPTAANAAYYGDIVARHAERRRLWFAAQQMLRLAQDTRADREYEAWRAEAEEVSSAVFRSRDDTGGIDHGWMSFGDFMAQDVRQNYLVDGIVPEAQGGIISGRFKTLKTSIALDLFISMATGTPFLGRFGVAAPVPCAMMTAESGPASVISICRRIAASKGVDHRDGPHISTHCATMTDVRHLERLERDIERHGWRCVGIDPTYLAFADVGSKASNVFEMGQALEPVTSLIQRTGCTVILLNHNIKGRAKDVGRFDPPDLGEISMSGFAEWMRFWLLLAQIREWDEVTGQHCLWIRTGGSAGHAGLQGLHVTEGEHDAKGRRTKWEVELKDVNDTRRERETRKAGDKAKQRERTEAGHVRDLLDALKVCDDFESEKQLRSLSGLNPGNFGTAIRTLLKEGRVEHADIVKRGNPCKGYRLKGERGPTRTNADQKADQNT